MSFDLYFYQRSDNIRPVSAIGDYLNQHLVLKNPDASQWFFENKETGVYYSFDQSTPEPAEQNGEEEGYAGFKRTGFSFNLNFMRPSFFGQEAFLFVEKLLKDLNLFVENPQGSITEPHQPTATDLYENWNETNLRASKDHFIDCGASFIHPEISNAAWFHNYQRQTVQQELGEAYFVPRIFFFRKKLDQTVVTLVTWSYHIPNVFPLADYYVLNREYKKWFRTIKDNVVIDRATLFKTFGHYFEPFHVNDSWILHPHNEWKVANDFNGMQSNNCLPDFGVHMPMELLYNITP